MSPAPCFRTEKVLKNKAIFILKKLLDNLGGEGSWLVGGFCCFVFIGFVFKSPTMKAVIFFCPAIPHTK